MKHFYLNSETGKACAQFLLLAFFSLFTFTGFSQQPADPSDIPNPLDDPSCTITSGDCTSKDLELVGAFLDIDTTGCNSCDEGEQIVANLYLSINNTTGSTRTSFAVFGNLTTTDPEGNVTSESISRCSGSLPPSTITTLPYGQITYTCGDALSLTDLVLSWTDASPNSTCENHDCAQIAPKCGTVDEIVIIPPLQSSAVAQCDGPVIDVNISVQGGSAPFGYAWTGPNGFTATTEDLNDVAPGTYNVIVTDAQGCTTTASATQAECCQFLATCDLDPAEQVIEGCDINAIPAPFILPSEVFTVGPNPCGDLVLTHNDVPSGALCPDGISVMRTYTLFDDLNNNQILDQGEDSATCVQNFKIVDATVPTFTVPADVTLECDQDAEDLTLTGDVTDELDNCSSGIEATYTDTINTGSCPSEYTITRSWSLTDACGNSATSDQTITVVDNNSPTFNEALPANTVAAYDNIPAPEVLTASDMCDPNPQVTLDESYIGDNTSTTYIIVRTWTASDCADNQIEHTQKIYVTENGDPIGLAINDTSVNENAGTATFTVTLTGEVAGGFTVDYLTNNGTAIAPGDFTAITVSQLAFGGNHGETKTISVSINDDSIVEDTENYEVNLSNLTTTEIGINKGIGNGSILDNDSASVAVSDLIVDEAVGNAQIVVVLSGDTEESFTVDFTTADDTAIAGSDYTAVSGQVTFPENSPNGAIEVINIPITDDSLIEPTEQFLLDLTGISAIGAINIADNQGIVSITDNDGDGSGVSFDATSVTVNEGDGTATFTVRLSGNVQDGFTLNYATDNGSAIEPGDYTTTSGSMTFAGTDGESYDIIVPINDDDLIEPTENFVVDLSGLSTSLINILTPQATGTILDNDGDGSGVSFDATSVTVNEGDGTATFTVRLSGNVQGGFTLNYATDNGSAIEPGDYTTTSGSMTFAGTDGESYDIIVPINDDDLIEPTENFVVDLSGLSTSLINILTPQATGTILDNDGDGSGVSFDATSVTVNEGDGTATFTVRLSGNVQGGFTLNYATDNGSAIEPGDYTTTSGSMTFAGTDGESYDIIVPINDDSLIEPTENFVVDLSGLSTSLITVLTPQATGTILDNDGDGSGVSFDATSVTVNEGDGTATFTVRLSGNVQGGFTLDYATDNGSAIEPGDYTTTSGSMTFAGTDGESYDIIVPINDDSLIEPTENFVVDLSGLSTSLITVLTPQATGTILDNDGDGSGVSFDATSVTVNEGDGTATFTVRLSGNVQGGFTLDYATDNGSAIEPGDYTTTSGSMTFAGTDGESYDIIVPINDDSLIEPTENFVVDLSGLSTSLITVLTPQATGTILDNDGDGSGVSFDATSVTVNEGDGTATFTVRLSGNVQDGFTLNYATDNGSAIEPGDYTTTSGSMTFAGTDGESYDIIVPINDDDLIEPTENFVVDLSGLSTSLITVLTPQATGTILDNDGDGSGVSFDATSVTVNEGDGTATFTVRLSGNVQGGFTLDYATDNGSAIEPGDYTTTSGSMTFAGTDGESYDIIVPINDDSLIEPTENFVVDLSGLSTSLITVLTPQATGTILDNDGDGSGVSFDATSVTVNEGDGTATFTVRLSGNVQDGFTLNYATDNGSAIEPGDYTTTSGSMTFAGTDGESYDIIVPINDDDLIEPTENFVVDLSGLSTSLITVLTPQATGTILDNDGDGSGVSFDATSVTVNEGDGTATFTVRLSGNVQDGFTLNYATDNGSAIEPGDYTTTSGSMTFAGTDGESYDIIVPINDDDLIEPTENFVVDLSGLSTSLINILTPQATGTILDNDGDGSGVSFDATSVTVNEGDGTATFTVRLSGNVQDGFTLNYATDNGSAIEPGDYTTTSGSMTFAGTDGESYDIIVPINDDDLIEPTENFVVDLSGLSTSLINILTPQATGTILDNDGDGSGVSFDATSVTVNEGDGTATFTVRLSGNVQGGFTLDYATDNGSAIEPGDYTTTSGSMTFAGTDGESYDIIVPINDDSLIEPTENFVVDLSGLSTSLITVLTPQATGTILDNDGDGSGVSFDATSVTVNEGDGTATFTVRLSGNVQDGFTLNYATDNGSAIEPGDYTTTSGSMTFAGTDGESYDIIVPINDDDLIEPTENFVVDLSGLSTGPDMSTPLISILTPQATGTILDNDGDGSGVSFDATSVTVNEGDGTATFTVRLSGNVQGGFTLNYATDNGSAIEPGDYTTTSGSMTFAGTDGESYDIIVPINDDDLIEPTENFVVDLSGLSTSLITVLTPQATGTILDNDGDGSGVSFDATSVTVNEGDGTATFTVRLSGNVQGGFTLDYATDNGSAFEPGDYTTTSGSMTFAGTDGESYDIIVPINDDSLIEPTENFVVDLSGLSTSLITVLTPQATGTILDNDGDGSGVSFDATSVTVNEGDGTATFTVRLSGNVQGGFTLDYATDNGSAFEPGDYTTTSGSMTFAGTDGESYDITIPIIDDVIVEDTESYVVDLLNISTPLIPILTPQATGTINDNDSDSDFPSDVLVSCVEIPEVPEITLNANGCEYTEVFEEAISGQDDECATEYTITRTWTITDCVENVRVHVQTITVEDTSAPIFVEELPGDTAVSCDNIPDVIEPTVLDNCDTSAYVTFDEVFNGLNDECPSEYSITRTWTAWDCAGNSTVHVQNITVTDTEAPSFVESLPADITVMCNEVPEAAVLTAVDNCDPNVDVVFNETITNDANCASGYEITRTWTVNDCAGNSVSHTQVVTIPSTGPITASEYEEEVSILCGDPLPGTPEVEFNGGCGTYEVVFTEETEYSSDTDDYMVIRTWSVTDACGNSASFEQLIFVFQPQLETVTIDICVEDDAIDLVNYLPEGFDTSGEFVVVSNNYTLVGSILNPLALDTDNQTLIEYSSTEGTCKYFVDFVINANTDCVPCGRDDIIASTTITPNGDGVNEFFEIKGVEFCDFRFDVMLFNRWGTKVFEGKDYQNDWGAIAPDNAFGSKGLLPTGTYYYIIHVTNRNFEPITGYIYIGSN